MYNIGSGKKPKYLNANPSDIEIGYYENRTVEIIFGHYDRNATGYQEKILDEIYIIFEVEFPLKIDKSAWRIQFDPPILDLKKHHQNLTELGINTSKHPNPRTKLYISLESQPNPKRPIKDFILTVNAKIVKKYKNMIESRAFAWLEPLKIGDFVWYPKFGGRISTLGFWKYFSNTSIGEKTCELHIKIKPYRDIIINISEPVDLKSNQLGYARFLVQNRGSHIEEFGFDIKNVNKSYNSLLINNPPPVTLIPGQKRYIDIGLISKPVFYDPGTVHSIEISIYPFDEKENMLFTSVLSVRTKGINFHAIFINNTYLFLFICLIFVFIFLVIIRYKKYK